MKNLKFTAMVALALITLMSCGGISSQEANAEGFGAIDKELKSKFGESAYYTDLSISYDKTVGNIVGVTVTEDPESLQMGQWNLMQNTWKQNSEITLEVPEGTKAASFMFQINDKINITLLGELVEKSITQLKAEKGLKNPVLDMAFVRFPKDGDISKTDYNVMLEPENGGTTFRFTYALDGKLIKMDY